MSIYKALKELGFRKDGTSLHLLQIAMDEQEGLRAEKFREYLIDRYGQEITLEGTRKALTKLVRQGFLKTERPTPKHPFYLPNETGILLLRMAVDNIYRQLKIKPVAFDKFRATSVDFYSRSGEERSLANFETKLIESEMETKGNVASWGRHWWFLKGYKDRVIEMMARKITSNYDVIGICFENTPVARSQAQKAKGDLGINLGISSDSAFDDIYFYAYGSTVMMAFYPSELNKKVTKIFQSYNALEEVPKVEFEELLEARNPVRFTYMINEEWASLWHQKAKRMLENASYP